MRLLLLVSVLLNACGTLNQTAEIPAAVLTKSSKTLRAGVEKGWEKVEPFFEPLESFAEETTLLLTYLETLEAKTQVQLNQEFIRVLTETKR